jgi:outer membrane protein OmpA-like peptidoglycan-associated protein
VSGGLAFVAILAIGLLAVYFLFWRDTGFTLVVKGAPAGSTIFVDGTRRGVTSGDGSTKIFGLKADDKRSIKVTKEGFTEFNDTVIGEDGKEKEIIAQMRETKTAVAPPVANDCEGEDLRVCEAERAAMDALDKLVPPFTADELARALNLHIINFESNSADVPPARKRFLEKAAVKFGQVPKTSVFEIGGHTDNVGAAASNLNLSLDRAKAVRGLLVNFGVSPSMITSKGYGSAKPKTENTTENGRFQNRRIEYTVTAR